jgi:hypothetical protein
MTTEEAMKRKEQSPKPSPGQAMLDKVREEMAACSAADRAFLNQMLNLMFKDSRVTTGGN